MAKINNLESLLSSLTECTSGDQVTVRDMLNAVGRRSYGPILLLLGFIAISPLTILPGTSWVTALVILLIAGQILLGRTFPWVPKRILDMTFPRAALVSGVEQARKYARPVDKVLKPRLPFLSQPPFIGLAALVCIAAALLMFPLGLVPFGPVLPSLAVLLFGLGLTARDGIVLIGAGCGLAGAVWVLLRVWSALPLG
ncbi:MAG: polysaccharide synthesis protein exod [Hyphomonas sp. BRH_c22]|uniref:exopolysaccharide biosynthesis protein n=1 Tax=Hyphomonas sp. BRH_c22 TaxID=1629710 RepID=UPI0005F1CB77|nr:exopolysaccharide biosynthesis protein [Hyphomonas sp. BRH_c22]KJS39543.1 MAG: polysaccharide synthesis protein exod [Hyphomonas sp. BRH_c22]